jgi:glyoxylase-like metal-dependent hydrolase (beta-lactamase superfamily II)
MIDTPGHTLGHMSVVVSSGTQRAFMLGDAVGCPAQLEDSEWAAMSDIDRDLSSRTREALYRELEGTEDVLVGSHFPELRFGRVLRGEGKRYFA